MPDILRTLADALVLDPALFADLGRVTSLTAIGVALLAAASTMLGHVAILKLNRITGFHLVTSLGIGAVLLTLLYVTQAAVTWALASLVLTRPAPLLGIIVVALLSLAPLVLNFLTALPHLGLGIGRVLEAWSFLVFWYGISHTLGLNWYQSLAIALGGWFAMQLLSRAVRRPLNWALSNLWRLATGRPTMVTSRDILAGMPIIPVHGRPAEEAGAR